MVIDIPFIWVAFKEIAKAIPLTLVLAIVPVVIGFFIGLVVTFIREYKVKGIYSIANGYVSFFRGTPAIMHIMLVYFGIPMLLDSIINYFNLPYETNKIPIVLFVLFALSLTAGAYLSEIIRSGISSVAKGQMEAAYSIGMSTPQAMGRILLPQALAKSIPNFTNLSVGFLHTTSIAFLVSQKELTGTANIVASSNLKFLESFIAAGLIYWGISIIMEGIYYLVEKRVQQYSKGGVA
ncbi:amino acid ABC transporter permease [Psychrobacillus soli]|uniref:Amino acid ABC transporter permease n=1 Tax=Psychrobacillus soli TaxID=1543965 RepID=A0A544SKJ5_9BACI|nr:amino acid ABC transporter permease [Psychrobacillus soli]TQR05714.1 amino acid ABC transporter permease [Psychrobacillus soli]